MPAKFSTQVVHAGERLPRPDFMPVASPIYPAVAYTYDSMEAVDEIFANQREGYVYRRYGNPTVNAFEAAVATLEEGEAAFAGSSGMASIYSALLAAIEIDPRHRRHIVAAQDCYGATTAMIANQFAKMGVTHTFADFSDPAGLAAAVAQTDPAVLICETASNPLLRLVDVEAVAQIAHGVNATLIVDNTFTTPYLCKPLKLGADFVVHSATKYLGGHDDVLAGVVVTSAANRLIIFEQQKVIGPTLSPFDAWLALRGLKTLALRMEQHSRNALAVAQWLAAHPKIERVHYPGLPQHPQHALAQTLYANKGFGGMLSFEIAGASRPEIFTFMEALSLIQAATTLGDVYSLTLYPAMSSHRALTPEQRQATGITENLVRLSVGIEDAADITADLAQALAQV